MNPAIRNRALVAALTIVAALSGYGVGQRTADTLSQVDPRLQAVAVCALHVSTVDFTAYHGYRTDAEHQTMLERGVSWVRRSKHQDGKAVDVMALDHNKKGTWVAKPYDEIAKAFYACGKALNTPITWGGEWRVKDLVHFELKE